MPIPLADLDPANLQRLRDMLRRVTVLHAMAATEGEPAGPTRQRPDHSQLDRMACCPTQERR